MATFRTAFTHEIQSNIEAGEARLLELRREASRRLEAISPEQGDNLLAVCALVFSILDLQSDLARERRRLAVLG